MPDTMEDYIYMITPSQTLTRVDNVTIPALQKRKRDLEDELASMTRFHAESADEVKKLRSVEDLTMSELQYVKSYLRILEELKSVSTSCCSGGEYDYDKENEILDRIGVDMAELKRADEEMRKLRQMMRAGHCGSTEKVDADHVEDVGGKGASGTSTVV